MGHVFFQHHILENTARANMFHPARGSPCAARAGCRLLSILDAATKKRTLVICPMPHIVCPRCSQRVSTAALVGQWTCRFHPGTRGDGFRWSCCGRTSRGCTPIDHAAPAGSGALALVPAYLLVPGGRDLMHPRPESVLGILHTDARDLVLHWTAGGQPHTRDLALDLAALGATVAADPGYWHAQPPATARAALRDAGMARAVHWRDDAATIPTATSAWRPHSMLPAPDDELWVAAEDRDGNSSSSEDVPPWAEATWAVSVSRPDAEPADPRAMLAPSVPVWVIQRAAPGPHV